MCGGTTRSGGSRDASQGLSPRVRGNQSSISYRVSRTRSIPACAGEPPRGSSLVRATVVYPRVCGGTVVRCAGERGCTGLSPRVRGNQAESGGVGDDHGSIPACAGEPTLRAHSCRQSAVYPRVCGGTNGDGRLLSLPVGLSPRVRGNRRRCGISATTMRSIPACAGEPFRASARVSFRRVYPRVCGGTTMAHYHVESLKGLSPRVRGNRIGQKDSIYPHGSIPACAGEPLGVSMK